MNLKKARILMSGWGVFICVAGLVLCIATRQSPPFLAWFGFLLGVNLVCLLAVLTEA